MESIIQGHLSRENKNKIENCFMIGKLAEDGSSIPFSLGKEPEKSVSVLAQRTDSIVFFIEPLSDDPELLLNTLGKESKEVYISFDNNNLRYLDRYNYQKQDDRVSFLREHFKNKLILFKPVLNYDKKRDQYHYNFHIILDEEARSPEELTNTWYSPIPIMTSSFTSGRFEKKLIEKKPIQLKNYNHALSLPQFIVCDDHLYLIKDESALKKYTNENVYLCENPNKIKRIELPKDYDSSMKVFHQDVAFFPQEKVMDWIDDVEENGMVITEKIEDNDFIDESTETQDSLNTDTLELNNEEGNNFVQENDFLLRLDYLARMKKLHYSLDDLYNFHTALKTSNFTILGGMSGTGKTELARLYAEALKMEEGDNLLHISVQPSYTEPSDLLGFLNPQTGVFLESEIGLVSFLHKASKETDKMHMVLFDEMNLGQVEHYFSDFISILELEGEAKRLRLFNKKSQCVQEHLQDGIPILNNVLFVGTANFDETTRDFSNRMLDRSNVIILEKQSFIEAQKYETDDIKSLSDYEHQEKNNIKKP
ncbi:McrB family protein [Salibacterium qingdaonense]|uniref:AAA domain (Dynein-related subfamily) n=1 Tax=Salibacterium qingdaonense TaxID=266892 RepID=A0A1I4QY75_9BACI|nr:ATP-binding protein [Salibacterium qingdaonense]SFM44656.1 AAA domain (dynein-related subfamily) [Salibacterium qingdaonense]